MKQLLFLEPGRLEWNDDAHPLQLQNAAQAIVRPIAVAACDLDAAIIKGGAPYKGPFALGHEGVAEVAEAGESVGSVKPGDLVTVPFQISCGKCPACLRGHTGNCEAVPFKSTYGFGAAHNPWGGLLSDQVRVPFADGMLVKLPKGVDPLAVASLSDNIVDGWRAVAPFVADPSQSSVLVIGGDAKSVSLYAVATAVALGVAQVDYLDTDLERLQIARQLGANAREGKPEKPMGRYTHTVDGSCTSAGLQCALLSTALEGTCFSVSIYFQPVTLQLAPVYLNGITLQTGRCHARPRIPEALELIVAGKLRPELVTSKVVNWDAAPEALLAGEYTKLVVSRLTV